MTEKTSSTIDFAIRPVCLFVDILFVPTWIIRCCRFSLRKGLTLSCIHLTITPGKFFVHPTILQRMWEIISSYMFDNAATKDYHFLCLLSFFPRGSVRLIVTEFLRQVLSFILFLKWYTQTTTSLVFFTDLFSWFAIYVCAYNIITICFIVNCPFISFELFIAVFDWFCNFCYWLKLDHRHLDWLNRYFLCVFYLKFGFHF